LHEPVLQTYCWGDADGSKARRKNKSLPHSVFNPVSLHHFLLSELTAVDGKAEIGFASPTRASQSTV
jgi:hypothetical protein